METKLKNVNKLKNEKYINSIRMELINDIKLFLQSVSNDYNIQDNLFEKYKKKIEELMEEYIENEKNCCLGVSKNGKKCKNKISSNGFCKIHLKSKEKENKKENNENIEICKALKKDGSQCTFKAKQNGYCGFHKKLST